MPRRIGLLQIGQVADRTGLSLRTLRFYEENGLVRPSGRTAGGFRLYDEDAVARLAVIKRMKPLGFTLEEMGELLELLTALTDRPGDARPAERLAVFQAAASRRVRALREQLAVAEDFAASLAERASAVA